MDRSYFHSEFYLKLASLSEVALSYAPPGQGKRHSSTASVHVKHASA